MARNEYPIYNGVAPSWADAAVKVTLTGCPLIEMGDIKSIKTGSHVEIGDQRAGGVVIRRTTGELTNGASMELYATGFVKFLRGLKQAAQSLGYTKGNQIVLSGVVFDIVYQRTPVGSVDIYETRIKGCRYLGRDWDGSQGTDAEVVPVDLNPMVIADVIDGKEVVLL